MNPLRNPRLCAVTIGVDVYILPHAHGLKLVDIMSAAIGAQRSYRHPETYTVEPVAPRVELVMITADQVIHPHPAPRRGATLITHGER